MRDLHELPTNVPIEDWRWFLLWIQKNGFVTQGITPACDLHTDLIWDQLDYAIMANDLGDYLDRVVHVWDVEPCATVLDVLTKITELRQQADCD